MLNSQSYVDACEKRRKSVENAMAIILTATQGPDELFMNEQATEQYRIAKSDYETFRERYFIKTK